MRTNSDKHRKYWRLHFNLGCEFITHTTPYVMLSMFTRRVTLSAHRTTATYKRIVPSGLSALRVRGAPGTSFHTSTARVFMNPQRNVSTRATVTTGKPDLSTRSITTMSQGTLTPEQKQTLQAEEELEKKKRAEKAAALRATLKARVEKEKAAAALKLKRFQERENKLAQARAEKKQKLARAKAEKEKEREAKKPKSAYITRLMFA